MKINNGLSVAVFTSVTLVLAACSGNPVDGNSAVPKTKKMVAAKKIAPKASVKKAVAKKIVVASKSTVVAPTKVIKKPVVRKALSRSASRAKKQAIAALGKPKRANITRKNVVNQKLKARVVAKKTAPRGIQLAKISDHNLLSLERFARSQTSQQVNTRSPQPVVTRAKQKRVVSRARQTTVASRAKQPVVTRARQTVVASRAKQPVATRARQVVRTQQPVKTRAQIQFAQAQLKARRAALQRAAANKARPQIRRASYKRTVKRPTVSRIDPNVSFGYALSNAAVERTKHRVRYDGKYVNIGYPWGDVPKSIGVCTDVVIRAYRRLGIDLQQEVHKDISQDFYAYPNLVKWGLRKPDPNIDHRRVYNLQAFFKRHKAELPKSSNPKDYKPGDLVTWMVGPNFPHIGVVVNQPSKADPNRLMIAHNIGNGPQVEDILFRFPMTGHYRYTPQNKKINPSLIFAKTPAPAYALKRKRSRSSLSYAELLQASKLLNVNVQATARPVSRDLLTKNTQAKKPKDRIMLAHLDASIFNDTGINQDALEALLK